MEEETGDDDEPKERRRAGGKRALARQGASARRFATSPASSRLKRAV